MMPATKEAWEQVGETWRDLGNHLQEDYRKLSEAQVREARDDREKLTDTGRQLSDHLGQALGSMVDLVKEPETKQSMDRVIQAMRAAISTTFNDAGDEVRRRLPSKGHEKAQPGAEGVADDKSAAASAGNGSGS